MTAGEGDPPSTRLQLRLLRVPEVDLAVQRGARQQLAGGRPGEREHVVRVLQHLHAALAAASPKK